MRAAVYRRGVVQVEDVKKPVPKDNEVLVRVHASTVCAADYRLRSFPPILAWFIGLRARYWGWKWPAQLNPWANPLPGSAPATRYSEGPGSS